MWQGEIIVCQEELQSAKTIHLSLMANRQVQTKNNIVIHEWSITTLKSKHRHKNKYFLKKKRWFWWSAISLMRSAIAAASLASNCLLLLFFCVKPNHMNYHAIDCNENSNINSRIEQEDFVFQLTNKTVFHNCDGQGHMFMSEQFWSAFFTYRSSICF